MDMVGKLRGYDQTRLPQGRGAGGTGALGKADPAVGQELGSFDPSDRVFDQLPELAALFVGDGSAEVLNLN
jgi:hypothetical protein